MTRDEILNLTEGAVIDRCLIAGSQFKRTHVVKIYGRGVTETGQAFVCFYTKFGENSEISGSAVEGDDRYFRLVK